jgi:hypothetical protein
MHIYSGISAPVTPGGMQSLFAIWSFQNSKYFGRPTKENEPRHLILFQNPGNGPKMLGPEKWVASSIDHV